MLKNTQIKLTISYVVAIMSITILFSYIVFVGVNRSTKRVLQNHERRVELRLREMPRFQNLPNRFQDPFTQEAIQQVRSNTILILIIVNSIILILSSTIGYWFAGKTLEPIKQSMEKQKKFVADAAHELKTPITSIKTYLEVNLRNKKLERDDLRKILEETINDVDDLNLQINELLKQSKHENLKEESKFETINISNVIESTIKKLKPQIEQKNLEISFTPEKIYLNANIQSISELLTILLDNAIKFNKKDGAIKISLKSQKKILAMEITDTGIGIDEKDKNLVFNRFYKSDTSRTKHEDEGMGLGLSIAKEIVRAHNGSINFNSKKDKGTTFIVKLPYNL